MNALWQDCCRVESYDLLHREAGNSHFLTIDDICMRDVSWEWLAFVKKVMIIMDFLVAIQKFYCLFSTKIIILKS